MSSKTLKDLKTGIAKFNENKFAEARLIFEKIIKVDQNNFDALHCLGILNASEKKFEHAEIFFKKSLSIKPNHLLANNNYANLLMDNGNYQKAKVLFSKCDELSPNNHVVLLNIGKCFYFTNELDRAYKYFEKSSNLKKNNDDAILNMSIILQHKEDYKAAINLLDQIIAFNDKHFYAWHYKGISLEKMGLYDEAILCFQRSISLKKEFKDPYIYLGKIFKAQKRYDSAIEVLLKATENLNDLESIYVNLSSIYIEINNNSFEADYSLAISYSKKALSYNKDNFFALNNFAICLFQELKLNEAIQAYKRVIEINPIFAEAYRNLGILYNYVGDYEKSEMNYEKSLKLEPEHDFSNFIFSETKLFQNKFEDAWRYFEYRFKDLGSTPAVKKPNFQIPEWSPEQGWKKILIYGEQGLGDQILFSTIIPELKNKFEKVSLLINERLCRVYKDSFPSEIEILPINEPINEKLYDYQIPIGSLGQYFRKSIDDFRSPYPLLRINNDRFEKNKKLRCGFTWKSKGAPKSQQKSLNLELLRDLFEISGIEYFSIQYSADPYEIDNLNKKLKNKIKIPNNLDIFNDIYGLLKFIDSCDFIFSTSNTNAHLSAALGKPTYLLLPKGYGKIWYWENDFNEKNLWYPSIKKFYQKNQGDWSDPISLLKEEIENYIKSNSR